MYYENDEQRAARERSHTYHPPQGDQASRYSEVRFYVRHFAAKLNSLCPPSRELSLAHTKLEEAVFWANAAIARNEPREANARAHADAPADGDKAS